MASYTKIFPHASVNEVLNPPWYVPPTFRGGWTADPSGNASRSALIGYVAGTASSFAEKQEFTATPDVTYGLFRWTSGPMLAGTTGGNIDMVMGCRESDAAANFSTRVFIYITQGDSDTPRGTVLDFTDTDEWPTTGTAIGFSAPQAASTVNYLDGDRLVIEMGFISRNSVSTNYQGRVWSGGIWDDPELTLGSTSVTAARGYFSFTTPILIDDPTPSTGAVIFMNEAFFMLDATTGVLTRIVLPSSSLVGSFPDASNGLQLSDGSWVFPTEATTAELVFMTADFAVTDIVALTPGTRARSLTLDEDDNIYIGFRGNSNTSPNDATSAVQKRDSAGALLDSYNVGRDSGPGASSIDLAADGETLYYVNRQRVVKRYNVATDTQLPDFATLPTEVGPDFSTAARAYGIRLLPSGEVLVADLIDIKRLDSAGTIIQRYTFPEVEDWQHVSIGPGATTFTAGTIGAPDSNAISSSSNPNTQGATGPDTPMIVKFDLATGAVLYSIDDSVDPNTEGSQRGVTTVDGWTPVPESTGTIVVVKIVAPSSDPTEFNFAAGGGLSPTTFSLVHNQQQTFLGLTPDDGYSIEETTVASGFLPPTYAVSNDSPIDNISVAAGEIVTVTVTNRQQIQPLFEIEEDPIRWLRRSPIQASENRRIFYNLFELEIDPGVGLPSGAAQDVDPQVMMRYSDDNGKTWSNEMWRSMGRVGKWADRLQWWGLGMGRNRVFEVSGSAAVHTVLIEGTMDADGGTDPPKS